MASNYSELKSPAAFSSELKAASASNALTVLFFSASWNKPSQQMDRVIGVLATKNQGVKFFKLTADDESMRAICTKYGVQSVPTVVLVRGNTIKARVEGAQTKKLRELIAKHSEPETVTASQEGPVEDINTRLGKLVRAAPVMLFMKGSPNDPKCGFSRQMVELLRSQGLAEFGYFDILTDNAVRQGLKTFSNWPTYPQLYAKGELLGGLDVVKGLIEEGEFKECLPASETKEDLNARLKKIIDSNRVMLFMKGSPDAPQCGFSRTAIALLQSLNCEFGSFDILTDNAVRQGLKKYSNWPTYPQLYVEGELIGGLDVIKEMHEEGDLAPLLNGE